MVLVYLAMLLLNETGLSNVKAMHGRDTLDIFYDTREKEKKKNKAWKWLLLPSYSTCQI